MTNWIANAAADIYEHCTEFDNCGQGDHEKQFASIIATHAEPLMALLRESKRKPHLEDCRWHASEPCDCGQGTWNARVEAVLNE